ncbi:unnamed protein product [Mycena citricolor]|uniref:PH domain-containing protein n=1 Tax=Mycena citricolor TaxID=2018698 RepID=A0AAD2HTB5_9AGAR|nr:unnamed protein product [Mycena citricolor]
MMGPRDMNPELPGRPSLQHQTSATLLIRHYEGLNPTRHAETFKDRSKNPIRQSFRNLLSVFKKSKGAGSSKLKIEPLQVESQVIMAKPPALAPLAIDKPLSLDSFTASTKPFPDPKLAGSLFYLSQSPAQSWIFCSAVLDGDTVHLTWPTAPSKHSVALKNCADVRSVAPEDLADHEKALLAPDVRDLKIFELEFDGCREKFGTTSVRERAMWVSAIWDAVVQSNAERSSRIALAASFNGEPSASECSDRALPPLPPSPIEHGLPSPPIVSPSVYSTCSPTLWRPESPSVSKFSNVSAITPRLAQIEEDRRELDSDSCSPTRPSLLHTSSLRLQIPSAIPSALVSPTNILYSYADPDSPSGQSSALPSSAPTTPANDVDSMVLEMRSILTSLIEQTKETRTAIRSLESKCSRLVELKPVAVDLGPVRNALGDIRERLRSDLPHIMNSVADVQGQATEMASKSHLDSHANGIMEKLEQVLHLLKEESSQRSVLTQQQGDSVRYLNELNSWLEAFVSGGTSQIQVIATGVEKLGQQITGTNLNGDLGEEIRQGLLVSRQQASALELTVKNLAAAFASDTQNTNQALMAIIDQHRQAQEGSLRSLAAELSSEIRGERIRFVDAMKEATAINVQMHVEQLKTELTREVRADLFQYYSKQQRPPHYQPTTRPGQRPLPTGHYPSYPA